MFNYKLNYIPTKFFVFGCGGTGSRLVPLVAQYIKSCDWLKAFNPQMLLIDFDEVETKNLARQNFISRDVGRNKAEVLASRYSGAFDLPITAVPFKVLSYSESRHANDTNSLENYEAFITLLKDGTNRGFSDSIVFICVDSIKARQEIVKLIIEDSLDPNTIIIDTGNENDFGQVKLSGLVADRYEREKSFYNNLETLPEILPIQGTMTHLPFELPYFKDMVPPVIKASCADLEQTMAINSLIANTAFSVLQTLLSMQTISVSRYNVSVAHGTTAEYYTVAKMKDMSRITLDMCLNNGYNLPRIYNDEKIKTASAVLQNLLTEMRAKYSGMLIEKAEPEESVVKKVKKRSPVNQPIEVAEL